MDRERLERQFDFIKEIDKEKYAALLSGCTREDIVRAAKRLTLDTIYFLKGKDAQ